MERVRARLLGYDDDGEGAVSSGGGGVDGVGEVASAGARSASGAAVDGSAARRVLLALLNECGSREERAQALAEACVPPGLSVAPERPGGARACVCTSPERLMAEIGAERRRIEGSDREAGAKLDAPNDGRGDGGGGSSSSGGGGGADAGALPAVLPSGEAAVEALAALAEDVAGYDAAVYSRLSPLERFGATDPRLLR
jgi:hypothetical protein